MTAGHKLIDYSKHRCRQLSHSQSNSKSCARQGLQHTKQPNGHCTKQPNGHCIKQPYGTASNSPMALCQTALWRCIKQPYGAAPNSPMALHQTALWPCIKQPYGPAPNSPMALHQRALWHCHWGLPSGWLQAVAAGRRSGQARQTGKQQYQPEPGFDLGYPTEMGYQVQHRLLCGAPCVQRDMCQALLTIPNYTTHHDKLLYNKLHHITPNTATHLTT